MRPYDLTMLTKRIIPCFDVKDGRVVTNPPKRLPLMDRPEGPHRRWRASWASCDDESCVKGGVE